MIRRVNMAWIIGHKSWDTLIKKQIKRNQRWLDAILFRSMVPDYRKG